MTGTKELLASCTVGVPDCDDTPASVFEAPLLIAVLFVLLIVGVASVLGSRERRRRAPRSPRPRARPERGAARR